MEWKATALAASLLAATPLSARHAAAGPVCGDCNIVLISIDTLRPDRLGAYGYRGGTSPAMDAMSSEGALFEGFRAQSYLSPISMASILTSLYPHENGCVNFTLSPSTSATMLQEIFSGAGYRTAAFVSAQEFSNYIFDVTRPTEPHTGFARGFGEYLISPGKRRIAASSVSSWLEKNAGSRFFLWLPLGEAHSPYGLYADSETKKSFGLDRYSGPFPKLLWSESIGRIYRGRYYPRRGGAGPEEGPLELSAGDIAYINASYDAGVFEADRAVGAVLEKLKSLGIDKKTLVAVHSIHGEDLGEHGYYGHYDILDSELRGALVFKGPGVKPGRISSPVSGLDLAPTLLEYAGVGRPPGFRGRSLLKSLVSGAEPSPAPVYAMRLPFWEQIIMQQIFSVDRNVEDLKKAYKSVYNAALASGWDPALPDVSVSLGRWKLIRRNSAAAMPDLSWWAFISGLRPDREPEYALYDLSSDPLETRDLFPSKKKKARELKALLSGFEAELRDGLDRTRIVSPERLQPYP